MHQTTFPRLCSHATLLIFILFVFSGCRMPHSVNPVAAQSPRHTGCMSCHRAETPSPGRLAAFPAGINPAALCLDCHHYTGNHHPVDIVPAAASVKNTLSAYPLFEGKITCLTCHEAHSGPRRDEPHELLRGGPYSDKREICFRCHYEEAYAKINPHAMLTPSGTIREVNGGTVCLMCHTETPKPDSGSDEVKFKADIAFLCSRCHPLMPGDFLQKHFHRKPQKMTQQVMSKVQLEQDVMLPLASDGMVTCSTCHNPHQAGVLTVRAALAGSDVPGRLRVPKNRMCYACHALDQSAPHVY
jgi:predicted CXXCH cytochrome family protein